MSSLLIQDLINVTSIDGPSSNDGLKKGNNSNISKELDKKQAKIKRLEEDNRKLKSLLKTQFTKAGMPL